MRSDEKANNMYAINLLVKIKFEIFVWLPYLSLQHVHPACASYSARECRPRCVLKNDGMLTS